MLLILRFCVASYLLEYVPNLLQMANNPQTFCCELDPQMEYILALFVLDKEWKDNFMFRLV